MVQPGNRRVTRFQITQGVLNALCHEHGLAAAVLSGEEGLPLATVSSGHGALAYDAEALAAATAQLRRAARQAERQLSWPWVDEVSMTASGGARLVGRCFLASNQTLVLIVVVPGRTSYRRATNRAIRAIRRVWEDR